VALVADDLREGADDLLLEAGRRHGHDLDELVDEGVGVDEEIEPAELRDDEPGHVVLQRQPVGGVEVLGQLVEEEREEARLQRGHGEEGARQAGRVRGGGGEEQLAEPRGGGGREGREAREEAARERAARAERAREARREGVRGGERRGLVRRHEERAARVREERRRRVDGVGGVGRGGRRALAGVDGAIPLQEHHRVAGRQRARRLLREGTAARGSGDFGEMETLAPLGPGSRCLSITAGTRSAAQSR
jgi:hypothetical protein